MSGKKAFTLIELMVVVLIIAILAAIAVPQYTIAVEKSRTTEAVVNLKAISDALNRYYFKRDAYPSGTASDILASLDTKIELPKYYSVNITLAENTAEVKLYRTKSPKYGEDTSMQNDSNYYMLSMTNTFGRITARSCMEAGESGICKRVVDCVSSVTAKQCGF